MNKRLKEGRRGLPVAGLFFAGFFAGVLIPNLIWKMEWRQRTAASVYLLGIFAGQGREGKEYLLEVIKNRGSIFLLAVFCGISVFGVPLAVAGLLFFGLQTGMLLTMSVLEFGVNGGILGLGLLFPQYLLYVPCAFRLLKLVYAQSLGIWRNQGLFPGKISGYFLRVLLCALLLAAGILLETYLCPVLTEMLIRRLEFF